MMSKTSIIFAPHPDDACLGCGGVISKKIKSGEKVIIVDITDGRYSFWLMFGIDKNPSPKETAIIRKNEEINAMNLFGVLKENIYFLEYEDGFLYEERKEAEKKIFDIIMEKKPSEIYIPCTEDKHLDHVITNMLVMESLKRLDLNMPVYEYFIWARPKIEKTNQANLIKIDISDELERKKTALESYESQITNFSSEQKRPILDNIFLSYFYKNEELFRKSNSNEIKSSVKYLPLLFKIKFLIPVYYNISFRRAREKMDS